MLENDDSMEAVLRRINWLIEEATSPNPQYDLSIRFTMRAISNYFSIGKMDIDSKNIKKINKRISRKALITIPSLNFDDWHKNTTNEHPLPLKIIWDQICNQEKCNEHFIISQFKNNPIVTITNYENLMLKQNDADPHVRYKNAKIEILNIDLLPKHFFLLTDEQRSQEVAARLNYLNTP